MKVRLEGGPKHGDCIDLGDSIRMGVDSLSHEVVIPRIQPRYGLSSIVYQLRGNWREGFYYKFNREEGVMIERPQSLEVIYNARGVRQNNGTPIKVQQSIPCGDRGDVFCLIGIDENGETAYGYYEDRPNNLIRRTAGKAQWFVYVAPEPVAHYPAIVEKNRPSEYVGYEMTSSLFATVSNAQNSLQMAVVRLATEYPAVMLVPKN